MTCILVVDDDPHISVFLDELFTSEGHQVVRCSGGAEALVIASRLSLQLILLDANMPLLDGYQVLWHLKDRPETRDVPVLMLTSRSQQRDVEFATKLGASAYMVKPFSVEDILAQTEHLLNGEPHKKADLRH